MEESLLTGCNMQAKLIKRFKTGLDKLLSANPYQINKERCLRFSCLFFHMYLI